MELCEICDCQELCSTLRTCVAFEPELAMHDETLTVLFERGERSPDAYKRLVRRSIG